ncbi:hypothetical protein CC1G_14965 [Coprinopsis cinerea okayama7|uniref:Ebp2-domain-containing protein n=1 Tax=Coprinopsis cinerea (strain Okayama-7 / 130 / ATCC MYA-4618 / FGSC 9003) TaxID=240176 RepID=D6RP97_COPC7|nr:hypothetical protein CC1G_14965 [Coprinopsis cinerea okayama7\|eukprot:XP_002910634.1 hypothetical protein CC1G_14965 [Coprinopsis cinerea okayama7\
MSTKVKAAKADKKKDVKGKNKASKSAESKKVATEKASKTVPPPEPEVSDDEGEWVDEDDDEESSDDEFDGVDEEGMERLLKALGENGLDEFDQAQLESLHGGDEDSSEGEGEEEEGDEGSESEEEEDAGSDAESEKEANSSKMEVEGGEGSEGEDDEEEEIALDETEDLVDEDVIPRRKVEVDNKVALERIRETIALDPSLPWTETLTLSYPHKIEVDVNDDLNRELAFYKQALHSANEARALAAKLKFPFTRPADYFAEMVKSDAHMERIRQRLLDEKAAIKKSEDKRKEREGKKFGKQVQVEKLKERERAKKEMEERLKGLKRKRKDMLESGEGGDDEFDIAVEDAISDKPAKRSKLTRTARDKKYGFGQGAGRRSKSNTRESTDNFGPSKGKGGKKGGKGGKGKPQRPGKARRQSARSR